MSGLWQRRGANPVGKLFQDGPDHRHDIPIGRDRAGDVEAGPVAPRGQDRVAGHDLPVRLQHRGAIRGHVEPADVDMIR